MRAVGLLIIEFRSNPNPTTYSIFKVKFVSFSKLEIISGKFIELQWAKGREEKVSSISNLTIFNSISNSNGQRFLSIPQMGK